MTTNANNPENEKNSGEKPSADGMEFMTISSFDKFATIPNDVRELEEDEQTPHGEGGGIARKSEGTDSDVPVAAGGSNYQLIREVVRSPRAVIYKARQVASNRLVVVKLILSGNLSAGEDASRFIAEMDAAMKLSHPGIASIYETGKYDGKQFVSMEHVDGSCLPDFVRDGPLAPKQAAEIAQRIAVAVAYAHDHGVVHRNLTPSNVLCGNKMVPQLIGFGQSAAVEPDSSLVYMSGVRGTPGFLSPEQVRKQSGLEGPLVDVYAVGAILYFLITARPPFQTSSPDDTLRQVLESSPVPPALLNPLVPADLESVCLKCLRKEPSQRYPSAAELAADLDRWSRGEPVHAGGAPVWQSVSGTGRLRRFINPTIVTLTVLIVVAAVMLAKAFYDNAVLRDLARAIEAKSKESQLAEMKMQDATRMNAELAEDAKRSLLAAQESLKNTEHARQAAELAQQAAEKARIQLEETQEMLLKAKADLEFVETSTAGAKLDTKVESVRQLALKGEFDEALKIVDELLSINVGQLPLSMREERTKTIESLRADIVLQKNNSQ
jgi:tRNA A-37 threonylcarbamoyl transferase component Bud32